MPIATNSPSPVASPRAARWPRLLPAAIIALVVLSGCGSSDKVTSPHVAATIVITAPSAQTPVAGTLQFTAVVKDADGNAINVTPTWSVAHGGGTINSSGLFTAGDSAALFSNTVVATSGAASSSSSVTVLAGALASVVVTPSTINLVAGGTQQFTAAGEDAHGNAVAITDRVWSIAAAGGTIDTSGMFTAGTTAGTFASTVTATSGAVSGSGSVTIGGGPVASIEITLDTTSVAIGGTQQYVVTARDANNNVVPVDPAPVWSIVAGGGTIDANGLFTAGTVAGDFVNTIHVVSGTVSAFTSVKVAAGALATIAVEPLTVTLASGATQQFTAVGKDAHDNVVPVTPTWSVVASGGTIDGSTGLFTAGTVAASFPSTVTATSGLISGTASVVVEAGALATIEISPTTVSLVPGQTQQFTVVGKDAGGNVVPITASWSVFAGGGTIDDSGLFTAGTTAGTFTNTVAVLSGSLAAVATVTVTPGPLATITVTPANAIMSKNSNKQYTAVGKDGYGNVVTLGGGWVNGNAIAGTLSASGNFHASTVGIWLAQIKYTSGLITGSTSVTITP